MFTNFIPDVFSFSDPHELGTSKKMCDLSVAGQWTKIMCGTNFPDGPDLQKQSAIDCAVIYGWILRDWGNTL